MPSKKRNFPSSPADKSRKSRPPTPTGTATQAKDMRPDLRPDRQNLDTFVQKVPKPNLSDTRERIVTAYRKGCPLERIVVNSGLGVSAVFRILGIEISEHIELYNRLVDFKQTHTFGRVKP